MQEIDLQPVLRCRLCNKPFDKVPSLKRHGYYCRSRRVGTTTRSRSCVPCAKTKTRCDNGRPHCARCLSKAIQCQYPPGGIASRNPDNSDATIQQWDGVLPSAANYLGVDNREQAVSEDSIPLETTLGMPSQTFTDPGENFLDPNIDYTELWNLQMMNNEAKLHSLQEMPSSLTSSMPSTTTSQTSQVQSAPPVSIPLSPTYTLRSFSQRPKLKIGAQRVTNLILHTLKSYPLMMSRDNNLPPFVHQSLISLNVENTDMEPLINCVSLVHMLSNRVDSNPKLFWQNVKMECNRWRADHLSLNQWQLLASLQALSIFLLIRLGEGETAHNNLDQLLVTSVTLLSSQFNRFFIESMRNEATRSALYSHNLKARWKDWILQESARRLCIIYQIVNMLIYFEPADMCGYHQGIVRLAPLPAKKQLWEAGDEHMWNAECELEPGVLRKTFGLAVNGDLIRIDESQFFYSQKLALPSDSTEETRPEKRLAEWEEWCAGMDGFGALVMLAASLVA